MQSTAVVLPVVHQLQLTSVCMQCSQYATGISTISLGVVMQSLLDGVDLEDLGMHCMDKTMREHKDISLPTDTVFPSWLKDYCKVSVNASSELCLAAYCITSPNRRYQTNFDPTQKRCSSSVSGH